MPDRVYLDWNATTPLRPEARQAMAAAWDVAGNFTWQDAINATTGAPLLRRADRKAHASVGYRFGNGLELGVDGDYVSERADFGAELPSYALAHLRLAWTFTPGWRLEARLENLTDRDYALAYGYNTPGRSGLLNLVWNGKD